MTRKPHPETLPRIAAERAILEYAAELASIERLETLTPGERLVLQERLGSAIVLIPMVGGKIYHWHRENRAPRLEISAIALRRLHRWLRRVVVPLAKQDKLGFGFQVHRRMIQAREEKGQPPERVRDLGAPALSKFLRNAAGPSVDWRVTLHPDGRVAIEPNEPLPVAGLESLLWIFVRPGADFPFATCSCGRIFVPATGRQVYHSPKCAANANRETRREQVREAVKRHRAKKRAEGTRRISTEKESS